MLTTTDAGLLKYLNTIMSQMNVWLLEGDVQRFVLVVSGIDTEETLERWQFNVCVEEDAKMTENMRNILNNENKPLNSSYSSKNKASIGQPTKTKSIKEIHNEIQAIIKQITASVRRFLGLIVLK